VYTNTSNDYQIAVLLQQKAYTHCSKLHILCRNNMRTFLADRTNGRAYATVLRSSSSVALCIVAKRCVLEQKLLLTAYNF